MEGFLATHIFVSVATRSSTQMHARHLPAGGTEGQCPSNEKILHGSSPLTESLTWRFT